MQFIRASLVGEFILARNGQIELFAGTVEDKFGEHPVRWRMAHCLSGLGDRKDMSALLAGRRRSTGRADVQIKVLLTVRTARLLVVDIRRENPGTFRADHADFGL